MLQCISVKKVKLLLKNLKMETPQPDQTTRQRDINRLLYRLISKIALLILKFDLVIIEIGHLITK